MTESAYRQSGVDIEAASRLIEDIKPHIKKTVRPGVMGGIGGFGALFDLKATGYKDPVLVSGTDGVGTKIKIAIESGIHDTIGIDAVAMCVNDIVVQGAEPLFFLDYFATGKLDNGVAERVIRGVADGCLLAGCALIGGETAEMPGLYAPGDYDLAGFSVGAVERGDMLTGERIREGDVILALASSGLHSNGFSLVRRLVETKSGLGHESEAPFAPGRTLAEALLTPTKIYVKSILEALKIRDADGQTGLHGLAHITGGGLLENVPRVIPADLCAEIDAARWALPPVFRWLVEIGNLKPSDMATTLNAGIGMAAICDPTLASDLKAKLEACGEQVFEIGAIIKRNVSDSNISLLNIEENWS